MVAKTSIVAALERRYDYVSARIVLREALQAASLDDKDEYDATEIQSFAEGLKQVGDRLDGVLKLIERWVEEEQAAPAKKEEKKAAPKAAKKAAATEEAAPAEKAEEKKPAKEKKAAKKSKKK